MSRRAVCFNSTQLVGQLFCFSCGGSQNLLQCTVCNENFCVPCGMGLESRSGRCTEGHTFEKKAPRAESARARPGTSVHHYVPGGNNAFRAGSPPTTTTRKWGDGSSSPRTFRATSPRRDFRLGGRRPQTSELTESRDKIEQKTTPPIDETISLKVSVDFRLETEKEDEEEEKEENDEESTDEEEENDTTKTKEEPQIRKQESILKIQSQRAKDTNTILSTFRTLPPRSQKKLLDELKLVIKRGEETSHPESPIRKRVPTGTPNISEVGQIKQTINNGLREFSQQNSSSSSFDSEMVTRLSAFLDTCIDRSFDLSSADAASQTKKELSWDEMVDAVWKKDMLVLKDLLKNDKERALELTDDQGWTLLHLACANNLFLVIHILLKSGANNKKTAKDGETPYSLFMQSFTLDMESRSKMIAPVVGRLLIPQEVHRKDGAGNTALHIFVACGAYQQVEDVIAMGADPDACNNAGKTPLDLIFDYLDKCITSEQTQNSCNVVSYLLPLTSVKKYETWLASTSSLNEGRLFEVVRNYMAEERDTIFHIEGLLDFPPSLANSPSNSAALLKGGSISKILNILSSEPPDRDLVKSFVWMYPKYVTAVEVFNILWDLSLASKEQSHNVMCFMQIWIEMIPKDFESPSMKSMGRSFADSLVDDEQVRNFREFVQRAFSTVRIDPVNSPLSFLGLLESQLPPPVPNLKELMKTDGVDEVIKRLPQMEQLFNGIVSLNGVAKGLTIWNYRLHQCVTPRDIIHYVENQSSYMKSRRSNEKGGESEEKKPLAAIQVAIDFFSHISFWCASLILSNRTLSARVKATQLIIDLADELIQLNNFNSAFAVVASFQISAIHRLKETLKNLSPGHATSLSKLQSLFSSDKSYKLYREALAASTGYAISYFGLLLRDLIYLNDSKPSHLDSKKSLVNFWKMRSIMQMIDKDHTLKISQEIPFTSVPVSVGLFINDIRDISQQIPLDLLTKISREIEGKTAPAPDFKSGKSISFMSKGRRAPSKSNAGTSQNAGRIEKIDPSRSPPTTIQQSPSKIRPGKAALKDLRDIPPYSSAADHRSGAFVDWPKNREKRFEKLEEASPHLESHGVSHGVSHRNQSPPCLNSSVVLPPQPLRAASPTMSRRKREADLFQHL